MGGLPLISGGTICDNPEVNKRVADMTALGRAGHAGEIGPIFGGIAL